jgi:CheY-like chemotaxis protein
MVALELSPFREDPVMLRSAVLVVDDDPAIRHLLAIALPRFDLPVFLAGGGEEALSLYREHQSFIGVALLDVLMPGMTGPEVLLALRELDPSLRAVFMSGHTGQYPAEELLALGAACILEKPFLNLAAVARVLGEVIASARAEAPAESCFGGPERRRAPRLEGNPLPILVNAPPAPGPAQGLVLNRSLEGLCLQLGKEAAVGGVLNVCPVGATEVSVSVEVRHCRQHDHAWVLGCRFLARLSSEQLELLGFAGGPG